MGLAESQRLLARLFTDASLRDRFVDDPPGVAAEFGLSAVEAESLVQLQASQVEEFARSLVGKRLRAVESLLPLTLRAIGQSRFAAEFRIHARTYVPVGIKKHRDDAVAFADRLAQEPARLAWIADLACWEGSLLLAHDPSRRWLAIRLRHRSTDLARWAIENDPAPKSRPTLVVWFRLAKGGRLRVIALSWIW